MIKFVKRNWLIISVAIVVLVYILFFNEEDINESDLELHRSLINSEVEDNGNLDDNRAEHIVIVDIKGEVKSPGVYEVDQTSRVNDVIKLAGGFTEEADESHVNLAQKVQDEMIIIVPELDDLTSESYKISEGEKVKINFATQEEIETLNGIGPAKAQAIIQYRDENGFFQKAEELLEVSGIGEKVLENIRDEIQIP